MQCPFCASELKPDASSCENCGAFMVNQRTTLGVFVGWAGMVLTMVWAVVWIPLLFLPFFGISLNGYPWLSMIIGVFVAAGLIWYSKSTIHPKWMRREN